jgi:hypothetical protein
MAARRVATAMARSQVLCAFGDRGAAVTVDALLTRLLGAPAGGDDNDGRGRARTRAEGRLRAQLGRLAKEGAVAVVAADGGYALTEAGATMREDYRRHYGEVVQRFVLARRHRVPALVRYARREVRREQRALRARLLAAARRAAGPPSCALCARAVPACLLEAAHLTPRCLLPAAERRATGVAAELMCRHCHALYDNGLLGVDPGGVLRVSAELRAYDLHVSDGARVRCGYDRNARAFAFHRRAIYRAATSGVGSDVYRG